VRGQEPRRRVGVADLAQHLGDASVLFAAFVFGPVQRCVPLAGDAVGGLRGHPGGHVTALEDTLEHAAEGVEHRRIELRPPAALELLETVEVRERRLVRSPA